MSLIFIGFYVMLSLFQGFSARLYKEGEDVEIVCGQGSTGTLVFWFQIHRNGPKYLLTTKSTEIKARDDVKKYIFPAADKRMNLVVHSFNKTTDSGVYTCASMNNNKLVFGEVSQVMGEPDPVTQPPKNTPATTKTKSDVVTATATQCACKKEPQSVLNCESWIFLSLVTGCGLLLLLLIITIVYCNRLRTRRCPHHYKRKPQNRPAGQAKLPNNHV